jgi:hypothetical protein
MTEERLREIEKELGDHPAYHLERELIREIWRLRGALETIRFEHYCGNGDTLQCELIASAALLPEES